MTDETTRGAQLRLPVQTAPVDRTPEAAAAIGGPGVAASLAWTDLLPLPTGVDVMLPPPSALASLFKF